MKTHSIIQLRQPNDPALSNLPFSLDRLLACLALALCLLGAASVQAANQTWTNAPVDAAWTNVLNWVGQGVPGALAPVPGGLSTDTVTFDSALPGSGIGGSANPVRNDDQRDVKFVLFDTANCGAYVVGLSQTNNLWLTASVVTAFTGGNVTVNTPVASPQVINAPIHIRMPNSANCRYDLINNAASASATLTLDYIQNDSATSRPLTLVLDGANTGANTIRGIGSTAAFGAIHLVKQGAGTWCIITNGMTQKTSGGDGVPANITVNEGVLAAQDATSLGAITAGNVVIQSNGVLRIDGVTLNQAGVTLRNGGTIRENGSSTLNGVTVGNTASTSVTLATTSSGNVLTVGNAANTLTGGAADTVLHVSGPGTVLSSQSANYIGNWSVDAGTLQLGNASGLGTGANLKVAAGGTFDVSPLGAVTYSVGTAGISGSGTGTAVGSTAATIKADVSGTIDLATGSKPISLVFTPTSSSGDTTHPSLYVSQGTLSIGGNTFTVNNASGTPLGAGTYRLIRQASGSVTSGGGYAVVVTGSGMASGNVGSIQVSGGDVNLVVAVYVAKNLVWQGGNPDNTWNVNSAANWKNGASFSVFNNSDKATFNSVGSGYPTVNLSVTVAPGSVAVDTTANNYTFSGSGMIAGATGLTNTGSGTLQIQTANGYLGGTLVGSGTVQFGVDNALPDTGTVTVNGTGVLDMNGYSGAIGPLAGNGTVDTVSGGTPVLTVGSDNGTGTFSGVLKNTTGTLGLTKTGNGTQTLSGGNTYSGPTLVSAGTLAVGNSSALGIGSALTIDGGTLDLNNTSVTVGSLAGSDGAIANSGATGTNKFTVQGLATTTYNGVIGENPSGAKVQLVMLGTNELRLNGVSTFSGETHVASGAIIGVGPGGSIGTGTIVLSNAATLLLHNAGSANAFVGNPVSILDNSVGIISATQLGCGYTGTLLGSATATNLITGLISFSGNNIQQLQSYLGRLIVQTGAQLRWGAGQTINNGGDNATFEIQGTTISRGAGTVNLGALTGFGTVGNTAGAAGFGNYVVGAKNMTAPSPETLPAATRSSKSAPPN